MVVATISEVSKLYGISTRTLRYYEEIGLISSSKKDDYAYRVYDELAKQRLEHILLLRKLKIKLSDISKILNDTTGTSLVAILNENLIIIQDEVDSLATIRDVYIKLIHYINTTKDISSQYSLFDQDILINTIQDLAPSKPKLKEEKITMESLNKANDNIKRLKDSDVRIIYLPSYTIAAANYLGENPEDNAGKMIDNFAREHNLLKMKPDSRMFGFNNPCPQNENDPYGYEFWITIPEEMEVPVPLNKKHFTGGLYAAYCIRMGDFEEWKLLWDWVNNNNQYEYDEREPMGMNGSLEEHLNIYTYYSGDKEQAKITQIDLLIPIKRKEI